jgi:hypothetical protein
MGKPTYLTQGKVGADRETQYLGTFLPGWRIKRSHARAMSDHAGRIRRELPPKPRKMSFSNYPARQSCLATLARLKFNTHDPRLWDRTAGDDEPKHHGREVVIQRCACMALLVQGEAGSTEDGNIDARVQEL